MASKTFTINQTPHEAIIGDVTLLFVPETSGALFAESYSALREAQASITAAGENVGATELKTVSAGMRHFVESFLLPESLDAFDSLTLPDRVLVQLLEYVAELYGSGSAGKADADGGPSSAS